MSLGDLCALACARLFRGDGAIMVSPMAPIPKLGARLCKTLWEPEGWMPFSRVFDTLWNGKRHVMMGATQIDRHGNQNISCIGPFERPKVQLLGVRGAPGNTVYHPTSYWVGKHSPRVFVDSVDMISGVGTDRGAHEIRGVVSNMGVFDFTGPGGVMRVVSLHPGVSLQQVQDATGFSLHADGEPLVTEPPTTAELAALDRLDPGRRVRASMD